MPRRRIFICLFRVCLFLGSQLVQYLVDFLGVQVLVILLIDLRNWRTVTGGDAHNGLQSENPIIGRFSWVHAEFFAHVIDETVRPT